jgi:hypothetical protein
MVVEVEKCKKAQNMTKLLRIRAFLEVSIMSICVLFIIYFILMLKNTFSFGARARTTIACELLDQGPTIPQSLICIIIR